MLGRNKYVQRKAKGEIVFFYVLYSYVVSGRFLEEI